MRILVCGWVGSTNLGDELVLAGLLELLRTRRHRAAAVSIDPVATRRTHGVPAIDHRRVDLVAAAARSADLVVWGGGGLVQDETSALNLPYHLSRAWMALLAGTPWVALGIGAGPLAGALGRRLARTLTTAQAVTVRDEPSQKLLADLGVASRLTADLAHHLDVPAEPTAEPPIVTVSLRPWDTSNRGRLPVAWRTASSGSPDWFVPSLAAALDRTAAATGFGIRFVALQSDRDHLLHQQVATAMRTPSTAITPDHRTVIREIGRGRVVVAMRYHAGVAATLTGRPAVLIGYSPKVDALATTLTGGSEHVGFDALADDPIDVRIGRLIDRGAAATDAIDAAARALRERAGGNVEVLASQER